MDSELDDTMFLIPTIFISSPMVNESLFATVSGESCDAGSALVNEEYPHSDVCCQSSISPDYESDTEAHDALYANLIEKRNEVEKLTEDIEEVSVQKTSRDYEINSYVLSDTSNKLYNLTFDGTLPYPEWASDVQEVSTKKSEACAIKPTPYDSLDSLLSKIADSVLASNKPEGTLSTDVTEEILQEESTYQKSFADNAEENYTTAEENFDTREAEEQQDRFDENDRLSPVFFSQVIPDEVSRPSSRDMSDRELLMVFEDSKETQKIQKFRHSYGPVITKLLEANYYIKPEGSYHLPTNSLAFLNNKNSTSDYNPYYAFLPEYAATSKIPFSKNHLNIKNGVARDTFGGSKLIKSCEFSRKTYPQDPLRFLTYVRSNNTGGDCHLTPNIQYNPYYTFLPKFDKGAANNTEARSTYEMISEVVKEVTHYESPQSDTMDESPIISRDGTGDGPPHDRSRESTQDKIPVIVERQKPCKEIEKQSEEKRDSNTKVKSDEVIQTTTEYGTVASNTDYPAPVVAIFPEDLIPETTRYMTDPVVAVISHLFKDTIPEPIVHETLSSHSGGAESYSYSEETGNAEAPVEGGSYAEVNAEGIAEKVSEASTWRDIGWQSAHRLLDDSDLSHREDSSEALPTHTIDDFNEIVWHSVESFRFNDEYCDVEPCKWYCEKNTLEPPEDFANSTKQSESLVMNSIYEHPHRHQEIFPDMLSSMSSGALLRYQYVGCPLCSSSSTVIDDEDLERLLARQFLSQTPTDEPVQKTRNSQLETTSVPTPSVNHTAPTRKVVTIARQLLHPQVDSFLASQAKERQKNELNCVGDAGFDDYVGLSSSTLRRGILANVRLAAGGSLFMKPSIQCRNSETRRSSSAGHGDGHPKMQHITSARPTVPRSAPPAIRRDLDMMKVSGVNSGELTQLRVMASPGQYDVFSTSGKGDEVSTVDHTSQSTECEKERSECLLLDKDRMFIFSWETDSANDECQEINKRSYTLLHWTDSPYKSPPKQVLADLLKRVISGVSSYHLQSKSLSGIRPSVNIHRARSLPKRVVAPHRSSSVSSKSLSQIRYRKCRVGNASKIVPHDNTGARKTRNKDKNLHHKQSIPLCHKHYKKLTKKQKISHKRTVTFQETGESSDSDESLDLTKETITEEGTPSELNMILGCPFHSESAIYTWWNQNGKLQEKSTQQMLLETSSNYSFSSASSEDCDFISWT